MTIPSPFSTGFPLTLTPFKSRTEQQLDTAKNYFAVAFKPGYALQASELNEIQEIFYIQKSLTDDLLKLSTGWTIGTVPWVGATPISKDLITCESTENGLVYINQGWYYIKDTQINGGIGVWIYNFENISFTPNHNEQQDNTTYGFLVSAVTVECTNSGTTENTDQYLQDQSNFNVIGGPCGAARIQLQLNGIATSAIDNYIFVPLFKGPRMISSDVRQITFINDDYYQSTPTSEFVSAEKIPTVIPIPGSGPTGLWWPLLGREIRPLTNDLLQARNDLLACLAQAERIRANSYDYQGLLQRKSTLEKLKADYEAELTLLRSGIPNNCGGDYVYPCGKYSGAATGTIEEYNQYYGTDCVACRERNATLERELYLKYTNMGYSPSELQNVTERLQAIEDAYNASVQACRNAFARRTGTTAT